METLVASIRNIFDLNEYEGRAYTIVATSGPLTATEISRKANIPEAKVYEVLRKLRKKSLVETFNCRPQLWHSPQPDETIKQAINTKLLYIKEIEKKAKELIKKLTPEKNDYSISFGYGKEGFLKKAAEILNRTDKCGCATTVSFSRHPVLDNVVISAIKRGIEIRMLGLKPEDELVKARLKWYRNIGVKIRLTETNGWPVMGVGDDREACLRIDGNGEYEWIWTTYKPLVAMIKNSFDMAWKEARKAL